MPVLHDVKCDTCDKIRYNESWPMVKDMCICGGRFEIIFLKAPALVRVVSYSNEVDHENHSYEEALKSNALILKELEEKGMLNEQTRRLTPEMLTPRDLGYYEENTTVDEGEECVEEKTVRRELKETESEFVELRQAENSLGKESLKEADQQFRAMQRAAQAAFNADNTAAKEVSI